MAVVAILAVAGPGVAGQSSAGPASGLSGRLTVLDWAGYDAPDFWVDFAEPNPDVQVDFEIGISDIDIYTRMAAGDQADLFNTYTGWLRFYVDEGLVQEIDTSRLTNGDKVPDRFKAIGQIDGKQYFLPWDWGFTSVLYRTDMVEQPIDSWAALFGPANSGQISMSDDGPGAVTVSSYVHGWDETAITPEQLEQIKAEWIAQREHNLVVLPVIAPSIVSAWIVAFTVSFDEVALALFLAGTEPTFPVHLIGQLRFSQQLPVLIAMALMLTVGTLALILVAERVRRIRTPRDAGS